MANKKFIVNVDTGIDIDGRHEPLGNEIEIDDTTAAEFVKKGWLVPAQKAAKAPLPGADKE